MKKEKFQNKMAALAAKTSADINSAVNSALESGEYNVAEEIQPIPPCPKGWENVNIRTKYGYVLISRLISSFSRIAWKKVMYPFSSWPMNQIFRDWLKSLEISDEDQEKVWRLASNGKNEFEIHASRFVEDNYGDSERRKRYLPKTAEYHEDDIPVDPAV